MKAIVFETALAHDLFFRIDSVVKSVLACFESLKYVFSRLL